jgi:DNA-directed RNA polymerase subunit RPC12/RpoP
MDIVFKCPHCEQELEVDDRGVGSTLECPACSNTITVPARAPGGPAPAAAPPANVIAAFHESKHFTVPAHEAPGEALIQKPKPPLEVAAKEGDKKMRIKTIKRGDCLEVGRDRFDEKVSEFLDHVGQDNIVSINTINYSAVDMATHNLLEDYGVVVVYKG